MSAGSGIFHSEYNYSRTEDVNFLQLWIMPDKMNIAPSYEQRDFSEKLKNNELVTLVSADDKNALWINQKAEISMGYLKAGQTYEHGIKHAGNGIYAFLVEGKVEVNGIRLHRRDAVGLRDIDGLSIKTLEDSHLLLIEIPINY